MGISERYTYYWTIFTGLPFGVGCFIMGIYLFFNIPSNIENLEKHTGKIEEYGIKNKYIKSIDASGDVFYIKLDNSIEFHNDLGKHKKILKEYFANKNFKSHVATVWTEKDENVIEQISVGKKIIIPYKPPYWAAWSFLIGGIIITTGAILYLKNNAEDIKAERGLLGRILFGKKKRR